MANKRKTTTAVVAGVAAVALLLGGTFAWTSISQQAKNESAGIVNVGGRLHDDFNGTNKDIYVENFTDPYNGGQPIYARIKLTEYMEVGKEAGKLNDDGTAYDPDRKATSVIEGAKIDDLESWSVHKPASDCAVCVENGTPCVFHSHWEWQMGGSTTFMPTFNKDKDSLEADINGTYHGTDATDKIYYDDYTEYTTDEADTTKTYSETGTAYYDNDPDMAVNKTEGQYTTKEETHYAKDTADATVITMQQWKDTYNSAPGNYWVYDTDGWAYWANPIMPGEATGLLLSNIDMFKNPGEKCYYSINVVGQFATVGDWEQFGVNEEDEDYPSDDAIDLLTKASESVPTVTVTNVTGETLVNRGDTVEFSATTAIGAAAAAADGEYEWVVLNENREVITTSTIEVNDAGNAVLTVGPEELSEGLYVAARDTKTGAVGLSAVAMQLYDVTISEQNGTTVAKAGATLNFNAFVVDSITGEAESSGVTWTVSGQTANTTISEYGVLTIDENEPGATVLTVTATSVKDNFVKTYTVTVADKYTVTVSQADNATVVFPGDELQFSAAMTKNGETVTPDIEWTVTGGSGSTAIDQNGLLTVDENEKGAATLTVKATCKADETVSDTYTVRVDRYEITMSGGASTITPGTYSQFNGAVTLNGETLSSDVTWKVTDAAGAQVSGVTVDETGKVSVATTVAEGTELTVTATGTADGLDESLSASRQLTVKKAELEMRLYYNDNFNTVRDTVNNGENRSSRFGDGWTYQIRVYDKDGNWITGEQAELTIWINGTDVTGGGENCTNGYDSVNGHWWAWIGSSMDGTEVTFKITYGVSTFEATIW